MQAYIDTARTASLTPSKLLRTSVSIQAVMFHTDISLTNVVIVLTRLKLKAVRVGRILSEANRVLVQSLGFITIEDPPGRLLSARFRVLVRDVTRFVLFPRHLKKKKVRSIENNDQIRLRILP